MKTQAAVHKAAVKEAAPEPQRRYRVRVFQAGLLVLVAAFGLLAFFAGTIPSFAIDLQFTRWLQTYISPAMSALMEAISWPGFSAQALTIAGLIVAVLYLLGLRWESAVALSAAVLELAANLAVKLIIARPRPGADVVQVFDTLQSYSFPSGHVMFYTCFFGFIWFLAFTHLKASVVRTLVLALFGALILLVGVSRIYLGGHWLSDVAGAYLLGSILLIAAIRLYLWGKSRFFVPEPVPEEREQA